jgi:hypothetical protein
VLFVGRHVGVILTGYVPIESVGTRGSDLSEERPGTPPHDQRGGFAVIVISNGLIPNLWLSL